MPAVGTSVARKDGIGKATGATKYADDLTFPGMLHGRTIRSTIPRGRVTNIRYDFDTTGFTIVDYRDIPAGGHNIVALIEDDQPFLVETRSAPSRRADPPAGARGSRKLLAANVVIEYEELEPEFDPEHSDDHPQVARDRQGQSRRRLRGRRRLIVEGTYRTGHQEHVYIEPNGVIAVPEKGGIAVHGSIQCPFYVVKALKSLLGKDAYIRVVQTETGGGFGGKEEYPSMIAGHATLLALKSGRPVKIIYDRTEDMIATTKRHPSIVRHRTGVKRDGTHRRDGRRHHPRRRRLRHAEPGRHVARRHSRRRPVSLRQHAHPRPRDVHQHAAQRRVPRLRRAADAVRRRSAHGAHRRGARHGPGRAARAQRARARRHHRHRPDAHRRLQRAPRAARSGATLGLPAQARRVQGHEPRHRPRAVLSRLRIHRQRRAASRVEGAARPHAHRRAHPRLEHGDRPGHAHDARADRRRRARHSIRAGRSRAAGHATRSRQRTDGRVAHVHGRRQDPPALRRGDEGEARRTFARRVLRAARAARDPQGARAAGVDPVERRHLQRRRVRDLRVGLRRRRGGDRSRHLRGATDQAHRGAGVRQSDPSRPRARARSKAARRRDSATRCSRRS